MPTYEYRCNACNKRSEIFQSITEKRRRKCPACGKNKLERLISAGAGFLFKGEGFYITDYRSESYKAGKQSESSQESKVGSTAATPEKNLPKSSDKPASKDSGAAKTSQTDSKSSAGDKASQSSQPASPSSKSRKSKD